MSDPDHPFSDPSVLKAVHSTGSTADQGEYNPFSNVTPSGRVAVPVIPQTTINPSPLTPAATQVRQHIDALEQTRAAIDQASLSGSMYTPETSREQNPRVHNFPYLPSFCPCKPCFYQDIQSEIPVAFQRLTTIAFYVWIGFVVSLALNMIAAFFAMFTSKRRIISFVTSIIWLAVLPVLSYVMWFRPLYKAFRDDSSLNFIIFFFVFFIHMVFCVLMAIGAAPIGFCGLIVTVEMFGLSGVSGTLAALACTISTITILAVTITSVIVTIKVHRIYRTSGASLARAQQEFQTNVRNNRQVQEAASSFVAQSFGPA